MIFYKLLVQSWTILVSLPCPNTFLVGLNSKTNCPKTEFQQSWFRKQYIILEKVRLRFVVFQKKGHFSVHNWTNYDFFQNIADRYILPCHFLNNSLRRCNFRCVKIFFSSSLVKISILKMFTLSVKKLLKRVKINTTSYVYIHKYYFPENLSGSFR